MPPSSTMTPQRQQHEQHQQQQRKRPTAMSSTLEQAPQPNRAASFSKCFASDETMSTNDAYSWDDLTTLPLRVDPSQKDEPPDDRRKHHLHRSDHAHHALRCWQRQRHFSHDDDDYRRGLPNPCNCLRRMLQRSQDHGGNMAQRLDIATRTTIGCVLHFSLLVFTQPDEVHLGAVWIGNIFFHVCLGTSMGESIIISRGFARSVLFTSFASLPFGMLLQDLPPTMAKSILPMLTFGLSFLIMSCPWLTYRNLMILVMYIVVAAPVRKQVEWHVPLGYCASYLIGIAIAILMNALPRPNLATDKLHKLLTRYTDDVTQCLNEADAYTFAAGKSSTMARAAAAGIELLVERSSDTLEEMTTLLPKAEQESCNLHKLRRWIGYLQRHQQPNLKLLQNALKQRFLGEAIASHDRHARAIRRILAKHMEGSYSQLLDAFLQQDFANTRGLQTQLEQCEWQLGNAVHEAMQLVLTQHHGSTERTIPQMAHLIRRITSFHSVFSMVRGFVLEYGSDSDGDAGLDVTQRQDDKEKETASAAATNGRDHNMFVTLKHQLSAVMQVTHAWIANTAHAFIATWWQPAWLWHDPMKRRLAVKTSVGMILASLFVSVDYLWDVSAPFGFWPGLTIASVNLVNQGSSFHKAADRLFGTILAAAYAMLIVDLFPGSNDAITIASIGAFTFAAVYLRNKEHAYKYTYAATSIGSMSYGSVQNDVDVYGYVPKRIQLIFVGVMLFAIVELLLFPRSSQVIVEEQMMKFFVTMEDFVEGIRDYVADIAETVGRHPQLDDDVEQQDTQRNNGDRNEDSESDSNSDSDSDVVETESISERQGQTDGGEQRQSGMTSDTYSRSLQKLKAITVTLKKEVPSALKEPQLGCSHQLKFSHISGFVHHSEAAYEQAVALTKSLEELWQHHPASRTEGDAVEGTSSATTTMTNAHSPAHHSTWPLLYAKLLSKVWIQLRICCNNLRVAYPDARVRPQNQNGLQAVASAASFRDLDSIRLELVAMLQSEPDLLTVGMTVSSLLELCRHIQKAGKNLEEYTRSFPSQPIDAM